MILKLPATVIWHRTASRPLQPVDATTLSGSSPNIPAGRSMIKVRWLIHVLWEPLSVSYCFLAEFSSSISTI